MRGILTIRQALVNPELVSGFPLVQDVITM
jgi:hypothetical protein